MSLHKVRIDKEIHTSSDTLHCYHCGEVCPDKSLHIEEKYFCCYGCMTVFQLLNDAGLCNYYTLNEQSGINRRNTARKNKFAFLEDEKVQQSLIEFSNEGKSYITFYIPVIHCSSCLYLLENLHLLHKGIIRTDVQFLKKEVSIVFNEQETNLRKVVETLEDIGYEPHISLQQLEKKKNPIDKSLIYRLGIAGFAFGNIMLLSVPEYFSNDLQQEAYLAIIFRYLSFALAIPVFFYSAQIYFNSAWKGIKHKHLNIDIPVALAILVTFVRSIVDVFVYHTSGYFDSMTGIVFFMLIGRAIQDKTYGQLSFNRDYTDYFPISATVLKEGKETPKPLPEIQTGDVLLVHSNELLPADGIVSKGRAEIDYSFVTGESIPVAKEIGELVYAGGRQLGGAIEVVTSKPVAQSYLTGLWNKNAGADSKEIDENKNSFVHKLGRNFTWVVLAVALAAAVYWYFNDTSLIWTAVTAVLIIACPCGLLLTYTFTNGYLIRLLGKHGLYLRNAYVIEKLAKIDYLVFDKTGTLTSNDNITATFIGKELSDLEKILVNSLTKPSLQSIKYPIRNLLGDTPLHEVHQFNEVAGLGAEGLVEGHFLKIGTMPYFAEPLPQDNTGTVLYLFIDKQYRGYFLLKQGLRKGMTEMLQNLKNKVKFALISGDKPNQKATFEQLFGTNADIRFEQKPDDKLNFIKNAQRNGNIVAMIGDGLNDAVALKQSDVGISLAENINNFSPAADAILSAKQLAHFDKLIALAQKNKFIIRSCFTFSVTYNLIGIYFAVQGLLSPLVCAILMPSSTLTIVLITFLTSNYWAVRLFKK
ncbi:MAG: heavy metal translocating P-type ATPase metal-binding domain-containing protein [Bacteroidia bacterium]|nr:heavy metal translocating P-type ATPase metal-binding domain-containing protein [Bacteroidia bacterium]